ncbi:unnamed protein product [Echinostoma caproni]|uniref:COesterase domain-containing protein n=1 Tax=Echinostoma caproni TaxID=27848 RepID=A0A183B4F1_9TREM|nr:unnamed protein product [Echinostoma caproni]
MLDCLRARTASELATAAGQTRIHRPNWRTKAWAPTVDGDFIEDDPKVLWEKGNFAQIPLIGGLNYHDGSLWALSSLLSLRNQSTATPSFTAASFLVVNETDIFPNPNFTGLSKDHQFEAFREMARNDFALSVSVSVSVFLAIINRRLAQSGSPLESNKRAI